MSFHCHFNNSLSDSCVTCALDGLLLLCGALVNESIFENFGSSLLVSFSRFSLSLLSSYRKLSLHFLSSLFLPSFRKITQGAYRRALLFLASFPSFLSLTSTKWRVKHQSNRALQLESLARDPESLMSKLRRMAA